MVIVSNEIPAAGSSTTRMTGHRVRPAALQRMYHILQRLENGQRVTARQMAEELEVSRKTVLRDLDQMRNMGLPVDYDKHRHTFALLDPVATLPAIQVTAGEILALYVGQAALAALGSSPHADVLAQAIEKLATRLPDTVTVDPAVFSRRITFEAGAAADVSADMMEQLTVALRECRAVRITYFSIHRNAHTERTVHPYHFHYQSSNLYLIAYCTREEAVLMFRVDRIRRLDVTDKVFPEPDFDIASYLGDSFSVYRGQKPVEVVLHFRASVARWIREKQWHPSQKMHELPDGGVELRLRVVPGKDLERWILSFGAEVVVMEPEEMRKMIQDELRDALEIYRVDLAREEKTKRHD